MFYAVFCGGKMFAFYCSEPASEVGINRQNCLAGPITQTLTTLKL